MSVRRVPSVRCARPGAPRRLGSVGVTAVLAVGSMFVAAQSASAAPVAAGVSAKASALKRLSAHHARPQAVAGQASALRTLLSAHRSRLAKGSASANIVSTPVDVTVTGTAGMLTVSAASSAAFVSFAFDGNAVAAPVAVSTGSARATLPSWGYSNGAHTVTAADCGTAALSSCDDIDAGVTEVDLHNAAPTVTGPVNGAKITGGFTISAKSSGGGLAFLVDGRRRGFDGTSPYRFAYTGSALTPGRHTISVVQCSVSGAQCAGPQSSKVTVTSNALQPKVSSLSPSTFSPNRDHVKDTTTLTFSLPDAENVKVTVSNSHGTVVRGPVKLGALRKGRHTWSWTGAATSGKTVGSGRYKITLNTSATVHGAVVTGQVWTYAVVDVRAPSMSGLSASASVYPQHDGYRDSFAVGFRINERAAVTLTIKNPHGTSVRSITSTHQPGHVSISWNGRDTHGHALPNGSYAWVLTLKDAVGNSAHTATHHVAVSSKKLVTESKTITKNGDSFYSAGASDSSCAEASTGDSDYQHGVWLLNDCFYGGLDIAAAFYHFTLPAASVYSRLSVAVNGYAFYAPTSIEAGFGVKGGSSDYGFGNLYQINTAAAGWYGIGSINAANYVSAHHVANIAVIVDNTDAPCDFDINQVRITVTYKVLR